MERPLRLLWEYQNVTREVEWIDNELRHNGAFVTEEHGYYVNKHTEGDWHGTGLITDRPCVLEVWQRRERG